MNIKKIDLVTLPVTDLQRSVKWYAQTLGLDEIWCREETRPEARVSFFRSTELRMLARSSSGEA